MISTVAAPHSENPAGYGFAYYIRHKAEGHDLLDFGERQQRYGRWVVDALRFRGKRVLDVGCACGSMLRGILNAGADIDGVDCSEVLIQLGREQWPDMGSRLFICDAVNLHDIPDGVYDWIHSCAVAEELRPELVPHILAELQRVVKPGGSFYCAYESDADAMSDGSHPANALTHRCLRPGRWWENQLCETGWQLRSSEYESVLRTHADSFLGDFDASWFVARRPQ